MKPPGAPSDDRWRAAAAIAVLLRASRPGSAPAARRSDPMRGRGAGRSELFQLARPDEPDDASTSTRLFDPMTRTPTLGAALLDALSDPGTAISDPRVVEHVELAAGGPDGTRSSTSSADASEGGGVAHYNVRLRESRRPDRGA